MRGYFSEMTIQFVYGERPASN
uniref:Uncharacterized protein n=1 Tax=Rhizophora mucronata TaxID=61149 RepID=A0A2P2QQ84_RHIMU